MLSLGVQDFMEHIEKNPQNIVQKLSKEELLDMTETKRPEVVLEREQDGRREVQRSVEGWKGLQWFPYCCFTLRLRRLLLLPGCPYRLRAQTPSF